MSSNYSVSRDTIIALALRKLGVLEIGDTPDPDTINNANYSLNLFIKQMNVDGLKMWKNSELIVPLTAATKYILGGTSSIVMYDSLAPSTPITDKPLKAIQGWYRNKTATPNIDTPVKMLSKQEYNELGSKFSTGSPNSFYYDPKTTYGNLYIYLTPNAYTIANLEFRMVSQMPINDISAGADIPDFPNEWFNCLVWNLADQLAIEYGVPMNYRQEIMTRAAAYRKELTDFDVETSSTFFQPDYRANMSSPYAR